VSGARTDVALSKLLSYVLRHGPEDYGLTLDAQGWVAVSALLQALALEPETLQRIVAADEKQRYELDATGAAIRARQGHSVVVELEYEALPPPELLFHGTSERYVASILVQGLLRGERHHVHLSENSEQARRVGARRGPPVVLTVYAERMAAFGYAFLRTGNGVWLTERVPAEFLALA
jgi:putative RNA 2'-phosphotransferase